MNTHCITLSLILLAFPAGKAGAQSMDQLLQGSGGTAAAEVPPPAAPAAMAGRSAIPDAFLVKPPATHKPGARLFRPPGASKAAVAVEIPFLEIVRAEAAAQGMDPALILAVIQKESEFDPEAGSAAGALGLMQMLPDTAVWLGLDDPSRLTDPAVGIKYGVKYMKYLWGMFSDDDPSSLPAEAANTESFRKMTAAYNAGPGNVEEYGGVPPFSETKEYVRLVSEYFREYKAMGIGR